MTTRRETLKVLAAAGAMQHRHEEVATVTTAYKPVFFTPAEYACLEAVTARIIPSDGTPGAKEAGVAAFIDEAVQASTRLQELYRKGLEPLIAARFTTLTPARQDSLLRKLDEEQGGFWKSVRRLTIDGFYTSKAGLKELGYSGKSFLTEFKGCRHPEHQA